jgi:MATE family multidrug resistance protein
MADTMASSMDPRQQRRSELRAVVAMSLPVVITMSSRAVMDLVDFTMIKDLGLDEVQAAILPGQMLMWTYIVIGMGIVSVISTFTSQSLGRGEPEAAGTYAWQVLYIAALFGFIGAALRPLVPTVIGWIGHAPAVQEQEIVYLRIALLNAGPTIAAQGVGWFFIGIHRPWVTACSALEANFVNFGVSFVLIFGHLGFEPMGLAGAAWGTLAGVSYRTLRLTISMLMPRTSRTFGTWKGWQPSLARLWDLLRVGGPCGFHWISEVLVWTLFVNVLIGRRFGTAHLIATNTVWQYMRLAFLPTVGMGHGVTSLVGKSIGAGATDRARRETNIALALTICYMGTLSVVYFLFGGELVGFFNDTPEVVKIGGSIMVCAAVFQLFDALGITYNAALRGAGDTFWPSMFFATTTWIVVIGGGWTVSHFKPQWGSLGPWTAAAVFIILGAVYLRWRWRRGGWQKIDLFKDRPDAPDEATAGAL